MEQTTQTDVSQVEIDTREEQLTAIPAAGRDLFLVSAAHAVIHAMTVLMPLIYPIIQVEYHLSYTQIGLIVAMPNAVVSFYRSPLDCSADMCCIRLCWELAISWSVSAPFSPVP